MSKARKTAASSGEPDFWRVARDWLHHWLPKVRGSSPKTVEAYRIGLESYVRWLETTEGTQRSHIGFGHFDRARLGRWVEWMRTERGYSDRTIMLRMTTMRVFLDHAGLDCFASMFVRQVRQCFSAVWADGFPRCRHRFPVM